MGQEFIYKKTFLTMQTTIKALQKVDPLTIYWQTALFKLKSVLIGVFDAEIALIKSHFFQKHEVSIESDSLLLFFLSLTEISDPKKKYWKPQKGLLLFRKRLYILFGLFCKKMVYLNHNDPLAGYFRFACILAFIQQKYY